MKEYIEEWHKQDNLLNFLLVVFYFALGNIVGFCSVIGAFALFEKIVKNAF